MIYSKLYLVYAAILCVVLFQLKSDPELYSLDSEVQEGGRNERSTPRTFVLPATPAVARLQERRARMKDAEYGIKGCMLVMHDMGYSIGDIQVIDNMELVVSLIKFQRENGIPVSGVFDNVTKNQLGCST